MRRATRPLIAFVCCAVTIGGCSKKTPKRTESAKGDVFPPAVPSAKLTRVDVVGRWQVSAMPETNDKLITHLVLNATGDPSTWTITYPPNPKPLPVRGVVFDGDSLALDWGPYLSARRAGMKATSHDVYRLRGGKLVGRSTSRYVGAPANAVLHLRLEGVREK